MQLKLYDRQVKYILRVFRELSAEDSIAKSIVTCLTKQRASEKNPLHNAYRKEANEQYGCEGEIEIDPDAPISECGDGAGVYVQAWVFVYSYLLDHNLAREDGNL